MEFIRWFPIFNFLIRFFNIHCSIQVEKYLKNALRNQNLWNALRKIYQTNKSSSNIEIFEVQNISKSL